MDGAPVVPQTVTSASIAQLIDGIRYVLLDCDGVLWAGDYLFPGIPEALRELRSRFGLQLRFITNNGTTSREDMLKGKFERLQCGVTLEEVLSSAVATCMVLRSLGSGASGYDEGNIFVFGNGGLVDELRPAIASHRFIYGLELRDDNGPGVISCARPYDMKLCASAWDDRVLPAPAHMRSQVDQVSLEELNITTVVVGFDFCYCATTVAIATMLLQRHVVVPGASRVRYVTPNVDPQVTVGERNWKMPGTGSFQAAIQRASGREPDIVCGKPNPLLLKLLIEKDSATLAEGGEPPLEAHECLMVGDRLSTDIAFGRKGGARTLFVETGCESVADVPSPESAAADPEGIGLHVPHFIGSGLVDVVRALSHVDPG
eukprot:CAMPEP_0174856628 /NCGR_PEP_ID=MMETSP1114-20130205/36137_1 /TAXON_ID=312471 /ORGANISM="Neobodo designis, Strain CCAP 1951/1" /LENGTH=373 /DNA_ID=CAMNT_0016091433 /DNA_START=26 /DNA_END=1143 /DNA_ORIENTATION=+